MPKSAVAAPAVRWDVERFAGKTFALTGRFSGWDRDHLEEIIEAEGGELVEEVTESLDYLIVGRVSGKTTQAGKKADKLNEAGQASIRVLSRDDFLRLVAPDRALAEAIFRAGEKAVPRWQLLRRARQVGVDMKGSDLRGLDLKKFWLWEVSFEAADLRDSDLSGCWNVEAPGARLDGAKLVKTGFIKLNDARLRKANLSEAQLHEAEIERADCTEANLSQARAGEVNATSATFAKAILTGVYLEQGKFAGADFTGADLSRADLRQANLGQVKLARANLRGADLSKASLVGADLTKADLREAILVEADLCGACVDGADFTGANRIGIKLDGVDTSKAKGLTHTTGPVQPGPNLQELNRFAGQAVSLKLQATARLPDGQLIPLTVSSGDKGSNASLLSPKNRWGSLPNPAQDISDGLIQAAGPFRHGQLQLDSVKVAASGGPYAGKKLHRLVVAAWCEAFGRAVPADGDLQAQVEADRTDRQKNLEAMLADLLGGPKGIERWNARPESERRHGGPYRRADLKGARMDGVNLDHLDFREANLEGASLAKASLSSTDFRNARLARANLCGVTAFHLGCASADLSGADLREANIRAARFHSAVLKGADLRQADASYAHFQGADLSVAKLAGLKLDQAEFDEKTVWPAGFTPPEEMKWTGRQADPRFQRLAVVAPSARLADQTTLTWAEFMDRLRGVVDPSRLANALQMLKAERFQLFTQVEDDKLVGVIRSQSSDTRVYACKLAAGGGFSCGTQNLRVCGGLGGAICKHLLVLIVGLAKSGQVDLARTYQWVRESRAQRPVFDKDEAAAVFLRHKGAEAGEIDWRPMETTPEDYYAL